jgi:hypothetical protein
MRDAVIGSIQGEIIAQRVFNTQPALVITIWYKDSG